MKWRFKYQTNNKTLTLKRLASEIMPSFGLDKNEIKVFEDRIEGNPTSFTLSKFITPIRIAVYDIILSIDNEKEEIEIYIRFYKLFIIPLIPVIGLMIFGQFIPSLLFYLLCVLIFGISAIIELQIDKRSIRKIIKTFANNS